MMNDAEIARRGFTELHTELIRKHYEGVEEVPIGIAIKLARVAVELADQLAKARAHNSAVHETIDRALGRLGNARSLLDERWS